jgi:hypothetical protein
MTQNKAGFDPTQTAEYWLEKGVHTVPLRKRSKRPKDTNWPHLRLVGADLRKKFKPGDNIGALWGDASDGATDIDLDMVEACWVAEYILPETLIYGRRDKPGSHYVFKCKGAETKKWQTKKLGTIVEIRSSGAQSVLPPSIHPDGDRYSIENDVEFEVATKMELERYCDEIAVAAVYLHHYPDSGSRHDYVHVCTGVLCWADWPEDKIRRVMRAVLSEVLDDDEEIKDRLGSVVNTIRKHSEGDHIKGFTSMEDFMPTDSIMGLRRWVQSGTFEGKMLTEPVQLKPKRNELAFNEEWLKIPGLIGDIAKWVRKRSYIVQPAYDLATAITCTSLASCNNYLVDTWHTPLQPYCMITGVTGSGKNSVLTAVKRFSDKIAMGEYVKGGFQSYYAMLDELKEPPNLACLTWDEAARHIASAKNVNGPDFQTITHMLKLFGQGNEVVAGIPGRKNDIPDLEHPALNILATSQPAMLGEALGSVAMTTGFPHRFILFDTSPSDLPPLNHNRSDVFPSALTRTARAMRDHDPDGDFTMIPFKDGKTYNKFREYEEIARRRTLKGDESWSRANQNALIIAGLAAVGMDPHKPVIDSDIARWAMQIVTWSINCWTEKVHLIGGESREDRDWHKVQRIIEHPEDFLQLAKGPRQTKQLKLMQQGYVGWSPLMRGTQFSDKMKLQNILNAMHEADVIGSTVKGDAEVYFSTRRMDLADR